MLLRDIKKCFHTELDSRYGRQEVGSLFYLTISHYLGLERFVLALDPDKVVSKEQEKSLFEVLSKLNQGYPIQYVLESATFMDMDFLVNDAVLIPRPETEELVRWVLEVVGDGKFGNGLPKSGQRLKDLSLFDMGTGSGCIAVALAKHLPKAKITAMDLSIKALEVAQANAARHKVDITFEKGDIIHMDKETRQFDVIVSNPPYVRECEKKMMQEHVLDHEPHTALFVTDHHPLVFYEKIVEFAKKNLVSGGTVFLEINQYLAMQTKQLFDNIHFAGVEVRKDLFGNDRMLKAVLR